MFVCGFTTIVPASRWVGVMTNFTAKIVIFKRQFFIRLCMGTVIINRWTPRLRSVKSREMARADLTALER